MNRLIANHRGVIAALALLALSSTAPAGNLAAVPMTMTPIYMNTAIGLIGIDAARRSTERAYGSQSPSNPRSQASPAPAPMAHAASPRFDVGADAVASSQVKAQFVQLVQARTRPEDANTILGFFERKPVRRAYLEAASPFGLGDRDLRDVAAAYLVAGWMVGNQAEIPTQAQVRGVRAQIGAAMESKPPADSTPVQRQIMAEQMMYDLVLIVAAHTEGVQKHDGAGLSSLAGQTVQAYRQRGFDPRRFALTNAGFQPR